MKTTLIKLLCLGAIAGLLASCKTTEGLGQDLKHLGAKIEQKADQHSY